MAFKDEDIFGAKSGPEFKDDDIFGTKSAAPTVDETGQPYIEITANSPSMMSAAEALDKGLISGKKDLHYAVEASKKYDPENWVSNIAKDLPSRKTVADFARPVLEGGGTVLGGLAGGIGALPGDVLTLNPLPSIATGVAGAGLGYAAGKKLADFIEGKEAPKTLTDAAIGTVKDVVTGAGMEAGGQAAGKAAEWGLTKLANARAAARRSTPALTDSGLQAKAGQVISENTGDAPIYAQNAEQAANLNIPGYKPSLGEARNDPGLIKLQRGIERQTGTAGNISLEQKAANQAALKDYIDNEFTGNESIDDVVNALNAKKAQIEATTAQATTAADAAKGNLNPAPPQAIGGGISDSISEALQPVKAAEREAWSQVPNYPIPAKNLESAITEIQRTPLEADTEAAVNKIIDFAHRMPKTTEGMQSIERTINDKMFSPNTEPNVKRVLGQLKSAIGQDFKSMGEAADAGDIALHNGSVVYPSKLTDEAARLDKVIAEEQSKISTLPDMGVITDALRDSGAPFMKQMGESDTAYSARLMKEYQRVTGQPAPTVSGGTSPVLDQLLQRKATIEDILDNLQPAEDVATAYRAAKDVSKERFDRFGKGAIADITKSGNESTGLRLPDAQIARKIFDPAHPEAADDFIKAVGPEKAAAHADQYAAQDLLSKANPLTGEIPAKTVAAWIQKNSQILRKYGISSKYGTVAKAQAQAELARAEEAHFNHSIAAKILGADPDKAIAAAMQGNAGMHGGGISSKNTAGIIDDLVDKVRGNPQALKGLQNAFKDFLIDQVETTAKTIAGDSIISPAAIQKQLVKYAPAMRRLYANEPGKIAALNRVAKAVEIQSRSARSPIGGGSDTAENANVAMSILGRAVEAVPGVNWAVKLTKLGLGSLNKLNADELNKYIIRALYDPDYAQTLAMAAKRYKPEVVQKKVNSQLMTLGIYALKPKEDRDPLGIRTAP